MKKLLGSLIAAPLLAVSMNAQAAPVDIELALVIDVSGSVSGADYTLQMQGYEAAFNNAAIQSNIAGLTNGLAVEVVFFSTGTTLGGLDRVLTSAADAAAFATDIGNLARPFSGGTNVAAGITAGQNWLLNNDHQGTELVIDVSGDGSSSTVAAQSARDTAAGNGITINAVAIDDPGFFIDACLANGFYTDNVITNNGQCFQATGFDDFERAITAKLDIETGGGNPTTSVPEPTTLALLGLGLAGLGASRKRKQA